MCGAEGEQGGVPPDVGGLYHRPQGQVDACQGQRALNHLIIFHVKYRNLIGVDAVENPFYYILGNG